jgi:hypothetical protein
MHRQTATSTAPAGKSFGRGLIHSLSPDAILSGARALLSLWAQTPPPEEGRDPLQAVRGVNAGAAAVVFHDVLQRARYVASNPAVYLCFRAFMELHGGLHVCAFLEDLLLLLQVGHRSKYVFSSPLSQIHCSPLARPPLHPASHPAHRILPDDYTFPCVRIAA